jgi:hypothetical protein
VHCGPHQSSKDIDINEVFLLGGFWHANELFRFRNRDASDLNICAGVLASSELVVPTRHSSKKISFSIQISLPKLLVLCVHHVTKISPRQLKLNLLECWYWLSLPGVQKLPQINKMKILMNLGVIIRQSAGARHRIIVIGKAACSSVHGIKSNMEGWSSYEC